MRKNSTFLRLLWPGTLGISFGLALTVLDYLACGLTQAGCPWRLLMDRISDAYDALVHVVGHALGVRYGYVPYYPYRATQVFLAILALVLPWLSWFLLGTIVHSAVRIARRQNPPQDQPQKTG